MATKKDKAEDIQDEAAEVATGEKPVEEASESAREELANPAGIRGAQEDATRRVPPFPGDGVNTGETTPQPGPAPGVTLPHLESRPETPAQADPDRVAADQQAADKRNAKD